MLSKLIHTLQYRQTNSGVTVPPNKFKCYSTATKDSCVRILSKQIHVLQYCQVDCNNLTFPRNLPRSYRLLELGSTMISGISTAFGLSVANVEVGGRALIFTKNSQNFFGLKTSFLASLSSGLASMLRGRYPSSAYLKVKFKS